jgi:methylated-DNA-[protein]-cysteine S-methyltransferase
MTRFARFDTPMGPAYATADEKGALAGVYFEGAAHAPSIAPAWRECDLREAPFRECARQLAEFFAGERLSFDLPLAATGTTFQRRVWEEIARIPYGETVSYSTLAARAGAPGAARAAGAATGRNPHTIVVPCHRVVGGRGGLTGYAGGLDRKLKLLTLEGALPAVAA